MFFMSKPHRLIVLVGLLGILATVPALGAPPLQPTNDVSFTALFTGELTSIEDLDGNLIEGVHTGEARCKNGHCNKKTQLDLNIDGSVVTVEYQFRDLEVFDIANLRAIVTGTGKLVSSSPPERFSFTATIEDNNGTVSVIYSASNDDASFIIPMAPGTVEILNSS